MKLIRTPYRPPMGRSPQVLSSNISVDPEDHITRESKDLEEYCRLNKIPFHCSKRESILNVFRDTKKMYLFNKSRNLKYTIYHDGEKYFKHKVEGMV